MEMTGGDMKPIYNPYKAKLDELLVALKNHDIFYCDYDIPKILRLIDDTSIKTLVVLGNYEIYNILCKLLDIKINNTEALKQFLLDQLQQYEINQYKIYQNELIPDFIDTYYHYDPNNVDNVISVIDIYSMFRQWYRDNIGFSGITRVCSRPDFVDMMKKANFKLNKGRFIGLSLKPINIDHN